MQPGGTSASVVLATLALLAIAGIMSWLGIQGGNRVAEKPANTPIAVAGPIVTVDLPLADPVVPPGPHRELFITSCTTCHSPRMVFTQPRLTESQWSASVKKMITTYGAPILPGDEPGIVTYLTHLPTQQEIR